MIAEIDTTCEDGWEEFTPVVTYTNYLKRGGDGAQFDIFDEEIQRCINDCAKQFGECAPIAKVRITINLELQHVKQFYIKKAPSAGG